MGLFKRKIKLFKHNQEIFNKYKFMRLTHKNIIVVQATGLGKTSIAIKTIDTYFKDKPILYVVPKELLEDEVKKNKYWDFPNVEFICYHSLKKYNPEDYSLCILDEVHRAGAPTWIVESKRFIDSKSCNVLGLTATEIRMDGLNVAKSLFNEDDAIYGLDVEEAIKRKLLKKPTYVEAYTEPESILETIEHELKNYDMDDYNDITKRNIIIEKVRRIRESDYNQYKIEDIIARHNNGTNKFIICTSSKKSCAKWRKRFKEILNTDMVYEIHSDNDKEYNKKRVEFFNNYKGKENIAIIGVNMLIEGLHIDGVSQIIMLRHTKSHLVFKQMIGRVLNCMDMSKTAPVIYDLVENKKNVTSPEELPLSLIYSIIKNGNRSVRITKYHEQFTKILRCFNIISDYIVDFDDVIRYTRNDNIIWTDEMMKDIYNLDLNDITVANKFNISRISVHRKRKSLGLIKSRKIIWTDEMMKDIYNLDLNDITVANKFNINRDNVYRKRKSLGLIKSRKIIWTDEMMKDVCNLDLGPTYISKKYNISSAYVVFKRKSLGINRPKRRKIIWTDEMIKDAYNLDLSINDVAKKYNINSTTVGDKRKSLGIKRDYIIIWTDEMMKDIYNLDLSLTDVAKKYNINKNSVYRKRKSLGLTKRCDIIWTDEMIKDCYNVDLSDAYIEKKHNISKNSVARKRKSLGIVSNYVRNKQKPVEGN